MGKFQAKPTKLGLQSRNDLSIRPEAPSGLKLTERMVKPQEGFEDYPRKGDFSDDLYTALDSAHIMAEDAEETAAHKASLGARKTRRANMSEFYYVTVVFLDTAQAREFIKQAGWKPFESGTFTVDGLELAASMGIGLPPTDYQPYGYKTDKKLSAEAFDFTEPLYIDNSDEW